MDNSTQPLKLSATKVPFKLTKITVPFFLVSQLLNLSLLYQQLAWWLLAVIGLCIFSTVLIFFENKNKLTMQVSNKLPSWLLTLIALTGCLVLALLGKGLGLLLSMIHLLCFAYVLKALEMKSRRDFFQVILLGFFLITAALIFIQNIGFTSVVLFAVIINFGLLFSYFTPVDVATTVKESTKTLAKSIPFAIVLFIVFPRLSPFWQVPLAKSAKTGLSDSVKPGDIAHLARSNDLAFRASFNSASPRFSQLYWRSLVLDKYDGRSWLMSNQSINNAKEIISGTDTYTPKISGNSVDYQIITEVNYQPWLFSLDVATVNNEKNHVKGIAQSTEQVSKSAKDGMLSVKVDKNIKALNDHSLRYVKAINQRLNYQVKSYPQALLDEDFTPAQLQKYLAFPKDVNPKLQSEALRLQGLYSSKSDIIEAVLSGIRQQNFFYTLEPPLLVDNNLDQFFFETRAGFCVHYASSFAFLMRAAGIPARLVTGYLGGEYNSQGDYFSLYQYDAHAWVEVWLQGKGWKRVDPTAAVAPERVESGLSSLLRQQQSLLNGSLFSLHHYKHISWLNDLRLQLDALDYQWTRWVIGYSAKRQYDLLKRLFTQLKFGQVQLWKLLVVIFASFAFVVLFLWWRDFRFNHNTVLPPAVVLYQKGLSLLAIKGNIKPPHMTARKYAEQVGETYPELENDFLSFTLHFEKLCYQKLSLKEQSQLLLLMKNQLKNFKHSITVPQKK
jgi:transglutaminase-like putative cysteine protease